VPCIVREFTDEADVVLAMLAENTQRSDGLNVVGASDIASDATFLQGR
jgi:ParB-like chromosome segregation protein Spo0J